MISETNEFHFSSSFERVLVDRVRQGEREIFFSSLMLIESIGSIRNAN